MAMSKLPGSDPGEGDEGVFSEINITPLTDIFLVLLIIFMVTSTVIVRRQDPGAAAGANSGIKVNLPKGGAADVISARKDLPVAVLADGRVVLAGTVVTLDELSRAFDTANAESAETLVIVQADEGVPHGKVVEVMELAKKSGLGQLAIGVRAEQQ